MSHKRPLDAAASEEQEAPRSPRKRLRPTVLAAVFFARIRDPGRRRARAVTLEQMVPQAQLDMVLVARLSSMESLLPNLIQGLTDQFATFQRSVMGSIQDTVRSAVRTEIQGLAVQFATFQRSVTESIEDTVRSVLRTEMQEPQVDLLPNGVCEPSREILEGLPDIGGSSGVVKLQFVDAEGPNNPLYTGSPVEWQNGDKAKVAILRNGKQIMGGDLSKLQIEILPVHADICTELDDFTKEEFNKHIYMPNGKESVLTTFNLTNGEAYLGSFFFKKTSHNTNLRLAARVKRQDLADRVQEAISGTFVVKDRRSESNEKSCLPSKEDPVHRLKKISQKGKRSIVLAGKNITTVKHLMRKYHEDESGLQKLTGMKKDDWGTMIKHAKMCDPGDEIYSYRIAEENCELLYNDLYYLLGMIINESYVPARYLDQFQQRKVNSWKMSAYKKFKERENSGGLIPDYLMSNSKPVPVPLNNEAGPSVQARPTWQYPNGMAAQQEFGEQHPFRQQNGFSPAKVLSNNDAGPSKQEEPLFSQHIAHQDLGQQGPMPQNGTLYCHLTQENILNGQGSLAAQPTIPSFNFPPIQEHDLITGPCVTAQHNVYPSSSTNDAPGTSFPVTDGVSLQTSSPNDVQAADLSWLSQFDELFEPEAHAADQGLVPAYNAKLPDSNNQFDYNGHDGGNL